MDLLRVAGDAASLLEQHGLVACGRKKNGVVTLDCWALVRNERRSWSIEVTDEDRSAESLCVRVLAELGIESSVGLPH